ncbi:MAG: Eukaryotic translation initiation factor eIF2A [Clostridia bacterium]|nr:Eukaryotic translation initiation factor eIF2A [Clostridia bacterium]
MKRFILFFIIILLFSLTACGDVGQNVTVTGPYWVENGVRLVNGETIVFEDSEGIYYPRLSGDGKYIAYSNGGDKLFIYNLTNGKKKTIFTISDIDYRVYAVGWSPDNTKIALMTSNSGGFIGGNELMTVTLDGNSSIITNTLDSADWSSDGNFVVSDSSEVNIIDEIGRKVKKLTTPEMNAFFSATNPTFSPDGKYVVYSCGETFYLHDVEKDSYSEIFSVKYADCPARINQNGEIMVTDDGVIYTYNPTSAAYEIYYDKANSSYPDWGNQ